MTRYSMGFVSIPPTGFEFTIDGQSYTVVGVEPYTRKTGGVGHALHVTTHCADCGGPMVAWCVMDSITLSRRCKAHRRPGFAVNRPVPKALPFDVQ